MKIFLENILLMNIFIKIKTSLKKLNIFRTLIEQSKLEVTKKLPPSF